MRATILTLALFATTVAAQTPVPAPPATPVAGGSLSGIVHDAAGVPLAGVNVTLLGETGATSTDSAGRFALRDVPIGNHTALFRRIGYASVDYRWTARAGIELQVTVAMTLVPRQLDRVVVEAPGVRRRRGTSSIGGRVVDSAGKPVSGADVRLLGAGLSTVTDSAGGFQFELLAAGSYILRARRRGLASTITVMQIADDDPHATTLKLYGLPKKTNPRDTATASGYGASDAGFDEFDRRERAGPLGPLLGPADLFRADRVSLDFVLARYRDVTLSPSRHSAMSADGAGSVEEGDCLLIDGRRPVYRPLRTYTSVEVLLVEVFRANAIVDEYVVSQMGALPQCRGSMDHHPAYFVLWTRSLR